MISKYKIMKTFFLITLSCLLTVILLLIGAILYLRQSPIAISQYVSEAIVLNTNMSCQFSSIEILILPFPSIKISDLQLNDIELDIFIDEVIILPSIPPLLRGELKPYFIELAQPVIKANTGLDSFFNNKDTKNNKLDNKKLDLDEFKKMFNEKIAEIKEHSLVAQKQIAGFNSFNVKISNANLYLSNNLSEVIEINDLQASLAIEAPSIIDGQISAKKILLHHNRNELGILEDISIKISDHVLALHQNLSSSLEIQCKILLHSLIDFTNLNFFFKKIQSTKSALIQNYFNIQGTIFLDKKPMPITFSGEIDEQTNGNFTLKNGVLKLDKDELTLNAKISLPFFKDNYAKNPNESFYVEGNVAVKQLNLVQWFGFARMLPVGIQNNLFELNGLADFNFNSTGLKIPKLIANSANTKLVGNASVAKWSKPVVQLTFNSQNVIIHEVYAESIGIFNKEYAFAHDPLFPMPDTQNTNDTSMIDVNYDILLNFDSIIYSDLKAGKSSLHIKSHKDNTVFFTTNVNGLYKGNAKATIELITPSNNKISHITVKAQLKNILLEEPSKALKLKQKIAGKFTGNFDFNAKAQDINSFLSSLNGTASIIVDNAIIHGENKDDKSLIFKKLEFHTKIKAPSVAKNTKTNSKAIKTSSKKTKSNTRIIKSSAKIIKTSSKTTKSSSKNAKSKPKKSSNISTSYNGEWKIITNNYLGQVTLELKGPISINYGKDLDISFNNIPLKANLSLNKSIISSNRNLKAKISGIFSFNSSNKVLTSKKYQLLLEDNLITGSLQSNLSTNKFSIKSTLALNDKNFKNILSLWIDAKSIPKNTLKNTHLSTQLSLNADSLNLKNIYASFDKTKINGSVHGNFTKKPLWTINLTTNNFDLQNYYTKTTTKNPSYYKPINLSLLKKIDAKGTLKFNNITIKNIKFKTLTIPIKCNNSTLECSPISAALYNSYASGILRVMAKNNNTLQASFKTTHLDMLLLTMDQNYDILLGGKGSLDGILHVDLSTATNIFNSLNADFRFNIVDGFLQDKPKKGQSSGSRTNFNFLLGSITLSKGILYNKDFKMLTGKTTITGQGWVNLITQKIDYTTYIKVALLGTIPVRYYGNLAKPEKEIHTGGAITSMFGNIGSGIFNLTNRTFSSVFDFLAD